MEAVNKTGISLDSICHNYAEAIALLQDPAKLVGAILSEVSRRAW